MSGHRELLDSVGGEVPNEAPALVFRKPERRPPTPFEQAVHDARGMAEDALVHAKDMKEFLMFTDAVRNLTPESVRWAEEDGEVIPATEWFKYFTRPELVQGFELEAATAEQLLQKLPPSDGESIVSMAATQISESSRMGGDYRVVARMPQELVGMNADASSETTYDTVYMMFGTACCGQAVYEVLDGESIKAVQFEPKDIFRLAVDLGFASEGGQQNFRQRDAEGATIGHKDPRDYLQFALKQGFSNERRIFKLSEFSPASQADKVTVSE